MLITTKSNAIKLKASNTIPLEVRKFDNGKYTWNGSSKPYIGRHIPDLNGVHAVYVERRTDSDGPYAQLMAIVEK